MKKNEIHHYKTKVRYDDLDMYSVAYHANYFKFLDQARNQAFEELGYPIEEQLKDKVGFTVGAINKAIFSRPLFMAEEISVFSEVIETSSKACKVRQVIAPAAQEAIKSLDEIKDIIFDSELRLVFVSFKEAGELPLDLKSVGKIQAIAFNEKAKSSLNF